MGKRLVGCWAGLFSVFVCAFAVAAPVKPRIYECVYAFEGGGVGTSDAARKLRIRIGYMLSDLADSPEEAIEDTERVELCLATAYVDGSPPTFTCETTVYPWAGGDVAVDRYGPRPNRVPEDGSFDKDKVVTFPVSSPAYPLTGGTSESYYYLRVTAADGTVQSHHEARLGSRSCAQPHFLKQSSAGFKVLGSLGQLDPWDLGGSCGLGFGSYCGVLAASVRERSGVA